MTASTWQDVPQRVAYLVKEAAPVIKTLRKVLSHLPASCDGYGYIYWHPDTKIAWAVLADGDDQAMANKYHNALKAVQGVRDVRVEAETLPSRDTRDEWIVIKRANDLGLAMNPFVKAALESPNALMTTLGGGLAGGLAGYGGGALLEHLFPERFVRRGRLRNTLGAIGAGVGALPGIWTAGTRAGWHDPDGGQVGWGRGFLQNKNTLPLDKGLQGQMASYDMGRGNGSAAPGAAPVPPAPVAAVPHGRTYKATFGHLGEMPPEVQDDQRTMVKAFAALRDYPADEWLLKAAAGYGLPNMVAGGGAVPSVPLDAFGQVIWNDTANYSAARNNPYGTKSVWGDNEQPMGTPPAYAAAAAGLVSGIGAQYGNPSSLSPRHFIKGLATAGVDLATAHVAGGVLGALGGLQPAAQEQLQNMGLWGGLIRGVVGSVFGR